MICDKCGRNAAVFRRYSGEKLCVKHFLSSVEKNVYHELKNYLRGKLKVGLAVSGGKDSSVMAYIVAKHVGRRFKNVKLVGLIVDEGIRGYRRDSIKKAEKNLDELKITYEIFRFKEKFSITVDEALEKTGELNMACTYCGVLRRRALDMLGKQEGIDLILTGHNASDMAQTVLLNVIQGNIKNLSTTETFPGVIRKEKPLRNILEREVTLYAALRGIDYCSKPCPYTRHSLRNEVRNFLSKLEHQHAGITYSITHLGERIKEKVRLEIKVKKCRLCGYPTTREICKACELKRKIRLEKEVKLNLNPKH